MTRIMCIAIISGALHCLTKKAVIMTDILKYSENIFPNFIEGYFLVYKE